MLTTYLVAVSDAKLEARHTLRSNALSRVSLIYCKYGLSFAASDLWKLASKARKSRASNVNFSVSGEVMNYGCAQQPQGAPESALTHQANGWEHILTKKVRSRTELLNTSHEHNCELQCMVAEFTYRSHGDQCLVAAIWTYGMYLEQTHPP